MNQYNIILLSYRKKLVIQSLAFALMEIFFIKQFGKYYPARIACDIIQCVIMFKLVMLVAWPPEQIEQLKNYTL